MKVVNKNSFGGLSAMKSISERASAALPLANTRRASKNTNPLITNPLIFDNRHTDDTNEEVGNQKMREKRLQEDNLEEGEGRRKGAQETMTTGDKKTLNSQKNQKTEGNLKANLKLENLHDPYGGSNDSIHNSIHITPRSITSPSSGIITPRRVLQNRDMKSRSASSVTGSVRSGFTPRLRDSRTNYYLQRTGKGTDDESQTQQTLFDDTVEKTRKDCAKESNHNRDDHAFQAAVQFSLKRDNQITDLPPEDGALFYDGAQVPVHDELCNASYDLHRNMLDGDLRGNIRLGGNTVQQHDVGNPADPGFVALVHAKLEQYTRSTPEFSAKKHQNTKLFGSTAASTTAGNSEEFQITESIDAPPGKSFEPIPQAVVESTGKAYAPKPPEEVFNTLEVGSNPFAAVFDVSNRHCPASSSDGRNEIRNLSNRHSHNLNAVLHGRTSSRSTSKSSDAARFSDCSRFCRSISKPSTGLERKSMYVLPNRILPNGLTPELMVERGTELLGTARRTASGTPVVASTVGVARPSDGPSVSAAFLEAVTQGPSNSSQQASIDSAASLQQWLQQRLLHGNIIVDGAMENSQTRAASASNNGIITVQGRTIANHEAAQGGIITVQGRTIANYDTGSVADRVSQIHMSQIQIVDGVPERAAALGTHVLPESQNIALNSQQEGVPPNGGGPSRDGRARQLYGLGNRRGSYGGSFRYANSRNPRAEAFREWLQRAERRRSHHPHGSSRNETSSVSSRIAVVEQESHYEQESN